MRKDILLKLWTIVHAFQPEFALRQKRMPSESVPLERASQEERNSANFNSVEPLLVLR